jgi:hypothetical protein
MKFTLFTIAFAFSCIGFSQSITGQSLSDDGLALPYANVLLFSASDSSLVTAAITDTSGNFILTAPSADNQHYITIQSVGKSDFNSTVFSGDKNFGEITIASSSVELGTINIATKKQLIENTGRGLIMNVSGSAILETSNGKEILEKIPGATINQDGSLTLKGKQGVKIFMDGKPTNLSMEDLLRLLENMQASEIEKIEVFEIPPAKYDASGGAGVINIISKKGMRLGFNGYAATRVGYGNFHKLSPYLRLNYRQNKYNIFGSGWYYNNKTDQFTTMDIKMDIDSSSSSFFNDKHSINHYIGYGTRAGIDYFITDKTTIGYLGVLYNGGAQHDNPNTVVVTGPASSNYDFVDASARNNSFWYGQVHNVNMKHKIDDGESLNIDVDFALKESGRDNDNINNFFLDDIAITPSHIRQGGLTSTTFAVAKLDYEKTIFKSWSLEAGAKSSWLKTENDFKSFDGINEEDLVENLNASNVFEYTEAISSAYGVLAKKWGENWTLDAGTRLEYTDAKGVSPTTETSFNRGYLNIFPNVSLAYAVPKKYSFATAYTRRIDRPKYYQLNPFRMQISQFDISEGNPELQPQISDVATITYSLLDAFYFTLSGSQMQGLMNQVIKQEEDQVRQVYITENLDKFENYSFNVYLPFKIKKWYNGNINSTVYYNKMSSDLDWGFVGYEILTFDVNMQQVFTFPKQFKIELSGFYKHDSYWNIWFVKPHYRLDLALSKRYKGFGFNLAFKDFLNIRQGNGGVYQNNINFDNTYKPESRKVILSVNYSFGNHRVRGARNRKTGSEDIQNRASE